MTADVPRAQFDAARIAELERENRDLRITLGAVKAGRTSAEHERDELRSKVERYEKALNAVGNLIDESSAGGVIGLHMNGNVALWTELCRGGYMEEWLPMFDPDGSLSDD